MLSGFYYTNYFYFVSNTTGSVLLEYFGFDTYFGLNEKTAGIVGLCQGNTFAGGSSDGFSSYSVSSLFMTSLGVNYTNTTFGLVMQGYSSNSSQILFGSQNVSLMLGGNNTSMVYFTMNTDFFWSTTV